MVWRRGLLVLLAAPLSRPCCAFVQASFGAARERAVIARHGSDSASEGRAFAIEQLCMVEDTDMFGHMYHGNYIKWLARASQKCLGHDTVLIGVDALRYRNAAVLGDNMVISGTFSEDAQAWQCSVVDARNEKRVFVTASVLLGTASSDAGASALAGKVESVPQSAQYFDMVAYGDELGADGALSPSSVINYMERTRTLSLGPPEEGLYRLHKQGTDIVISRISDLRLDHTVRIAPGAELEVVNSGSANRRTVSVRQRVYVKAPDEVSGRRLIAHATVELLCIDGATKKLSAFPDWILERLHVISSI
ncbi:hypothetical protein JKP88DRAFT_323040 [Tribonema minus]|uniref:Thioesterase domain-containing protein n=1 Tax=Tribonema minus TaxID=303371 RepID=A0A835YTJ2_9STRA|nr:hypothetical protein JKP88DRAFT_323040 [Tribonema minus]